MRISLLSFLSFVLLSFPCFAQNTVNSSSLTFTAIPDVSGSCGGNRANGINPRGDIIGHYNDCTPGTPHAYLFKKGSASPTPIDFSAAPFNSSGGTTARGISARGDIVGHYIDNLGAEHGYLLSNGVFSSVDATSLGAVQTDARGLNNAGEIVGGYLDTAGVLHGFFLSKGAYQTIDFPGSLGSEVSGLSDDETMVGAYFDNTGVHGFVRSPAGVFTPINGPTEFTLARGINAQGDIVGSYANSSDLTGEKVVGSHGFLLNAGDLTDFIAIDFQATGVQGTQARGVNPRGDIVGAWVDSSGVDHGFLATR
jgi:hypothetical protein